MTDPAAAPKLGNGVSADSRSALASSEIGTEALPGSASKNSLPADPVAANTATREPVSNRLYVGSTTPSSDEKCLHGQRGGEDPDSALDKMGVDKSPRTARTAGGATQEVVAPMPDKTATRFTVFAVSRECKTFSSSDGIPFGHRESESAIKQLARTLDADRQAHPTRIVERERAYPFKEVRTIWRCG